MDWPRKLFIAAFLLVGAAIDGAHSDAMVSGTVFCDQCKDGQISLFDYPLYGMKVSIVCGDENGQTTVWKEGTTNWFGSYAMKIEGTPDLGACYAQVSGTQQGGTTGCGAAAGPARRLKLMFRMFDMAMYTVDPLLSQPAQPKSFCPRPSTPVRTPENPGPLPPPTNPVMLPPPSNPVAPPPVFQLPPMPPLPPMPFIQASACPHENWTMPEYRCYWKAVRPDTKVAAVFGVVAARRYGTEMTLWEAMSGRGDPYRTLLREATTSLLNSYNSLQFAYHPLSVIQHVNEALMGSNRQILISALRFKRANSGSASGTPNVTCKFTPCK